MVTQKPETADRGRQSDSSEAREASRPLTAESAGVTMTSSEANLGVKAMRAASGVTDAPTNLTITDESAKKTWSPDLKSDPLHDFSRSGKNEYNEWAGRQARRHNLTEDVSKDTTEENAYRHAITSAIYTMKYGAPFTSEMGWANEQKDFNIVSSMRGKIDLNKIADTNADLLNNQAGIDIALKLVREKGAANVTLKDIEDAVMKDLKAGKLVTHPLQELSSGRLAPEMLSYHRMPGLIQWEAENGPTEADRAKAREILKQRNIK